MWWGGGGGVGGMWGGGGSTLKGGTYPTNEDLNFHSG